MRRASAALWLVVLTGCPSVGSYQCERDEDYNREGAQGRCLPDAACAYPESGGRCESGWARSPNAAASPGACIDPPSSGTTSSDDTGSATSSSSGATSSSSGATAGTDGDTDPSPCAAAMVTLDTGVFSPGAGQDAFVLWMPLSDWPKGAARLESGDGLSITTTAGDVLPYEQRALLDGTPALWVRLPSFEADTTLELAFTFGDDLEAPAAESVWQADYVGVWHLDDAPMGLDGDIARNAVVTEEPGMLYGAMQPEQQVEGPLGPALAFDGDDDLVELRPGFLGQLDAFTISMWIRADNPDVASRGSFFQRLNGDYLYQRCWHGSDTNGLLICQQSVSGDINSTATAEDLPVGEWLHLALVRTPESGITALYLQGEIVGSFEDVVGGTLDTEDDPLPMELGHGEWGSLLGALDEVRVSDHPLPQTRIRADYRSQRGSLEIADFGPIEPASCPL